jgi:hypothetical protein
LRISLAIFNDCIVNSGAIKIMIAVNYCLHNSNLYGIRQDKDVRDCVRNIIVQNINQIIRIKEKMYFGR